MRVTPAAVAVPLLLLLLTWLGVSGLNPDAQRLDGVVAALDHFAMVESRLRRDVLTARAGMLRNYDPLAQEAKELDEALVRLRAAVAWDAKETAAIDQLAASVSRQEELVEQFKSDNSLLQNSLAYFGLFSARLGGSDRQGPLFAAVSALGAAMLRLTLDTSPAVAREVKDRLDGLAAQDVPPDDAGSIQGLLAHGRLLHDLLPATDGVLKALFAVPVGPDETTVRAVLQAYRQAARESARQFRLWLYATSLVLLALLVHLGLRLRARAGALQRRAALEHVIAGISTRFINAQPQQVGALVERALAELSQCVGADRAYFVLAGTPARVHAWCREGISYPHGWPDQTLALAARFERTAEGIIYVRHVGRLAASPDRDWLVGAGLQGWACVPRMSNGTVEGILGFDALRSRFATQSGEFGLLRMALDAIANAVGREVLEQERVRLEARLQQARRMETVGALASGIAHNFNNIVGAILGHAELAQARLASDSRPARNVDAIRRAGERARDLVDQILAFGRRRDVRRRPLSVQAAVAEAVSLLGASLPARIELAVGEASEGVVVSGEAAQLQQVILNLCNNAAQAMDDVGVVKIDTEVHRLSQARSLSHGTLAPGRYVCIAVSDRGRGMDGVTLGRIFEPFFTTRLAGNGFGLATVREIVREHGGAMNVRSTPGVGSRFEAWLPCIAATVPAAEDRSALPLGRGETLLVVDDDRDRLLRAEELLAALGYEPVGYTTARGALAACRAKPDRFDAMVVEHLVLTASAIEFATVLGDIAPRLPILLMAASADEIGADLLAGMPIAEVVHRPLQSIEIAAALKRGLSAPAIALATPTGN